MRGRKGDRREGKKAGRKKELGGERTGDGASHSVHVQCMYSISGCRHLSFVSGVVVNTST